MQNQCAAPCAEPGETIQSERTPLNSLSPATPKPVIPNAPHPRSNGATRLVAPMPGVVTIFEKGPGDEVQKGDVVMILEAMKMENLITSPIHGKVVSILCKEGERVGKGTLLALIG